MLCDICKKREATVHLTEVINEEVHELHICEKCAKEKSMQMQQHFGIADLLSGLTDLPHGTAPKKKLIHIKCPSCGMSYDDFKRLGRFGCADCYESFKRALYPLFKKIHGVPYQAGKKPEAATVSKKFTKKKNSADAGSAVNRLEQLKAALARAVEQEEFEQAAVLRDKIRMITAQNKKPKKSEKKDENRRPDK